jgi:hypothetical protein
MFKTNAPQVFEEIDSWLLAVTQELEDTARGLGAQALRTLALYSAQYSGDFAANWKVSINNEPPPPFEEGVIHSRLDPTYYGSKDTGKFTPSIMGDPAAISHTLEQAAGRMSRFKLGDTIWLSNSARHDELYAWKIENNEIKFRPGNKGEPVRRTLEEMRTNYTTIDRATVKRLIEGKL